MNQSVGKLSAMTSESGSGGLSSKISTLEQLVFSMRKEVDYMNKKLENLRAQKDQLDIESIERNTESRHKLLTDLSKLEQSIGRHFIHQKAENSRLNTQVSNLKEYNISVD